MTALRSNELGQLVVAGYDDERCSAETAKAVSRLNPAGFLFTPQSLRKNESVAALARALAEALSTKPFLALEEEGGRLDPLRRIFPALPSPQAAARGVRSAERLGGLIGAALALLGFNTDLAPVLDLSPAGFDSVAAARSFSSAPRDVADSARAFLRGLERHGILACGKHFPGLGALPPHGASVSDKPMVSLWREDLWPYRRLIGRLPIILVSDAAYKAYDFDFPMPAKFSSNIVEGLLRVKLGFQGVALARLAGETESDAADFGKMAVEAIRAGCDALLVADLKSAAAALSALREGIESGRIPKRRIRQALARVRRAKRHLRRPTGRIVAARFEETWNEFEAFASHFAPGEQRRIA